MEPIPTIHPITKRTLAVSMIAGILSGIFIGVLMAQNIPLLQIFALNPATTAAEKFENEFVQLFNATNFNFVASYPEEKLFLTNYSTGPHNSYFDVIDFENKKIYRNAGEVNIGAEERIFNILDIPKAFLGNDKLLVVYYEGQPDEASFIQKVLVKDFNGQIVKELYVTEPGESVSWVHQYGSKVEVAIMKSEFEDDVYVVDAATLEWNPRLNREE